MEQVIMKKLQTFVKSVGIKTMEAGLFFNLIISSKVYGSSHSALEVGVGKANPGGVPESLIGDGGIFQRVANVLLLVLGAVAVIMLIIGGFRYVVSGGDSNAIEGAKNTILYAIIGIVVAFLAYAAVNFVINQLGTGGSGSGGGVGFLFNLVA